jgi:hypothetical protein
MRSYDAHAMLLCICPRTTMCPHTTIYLSSYYYMCPHTTIHLSAYY